MPKKPNTRIAIDQMTLSLIKDELLNPEDRLVLVDHAIKLLHIYNDSVRKYQPPRGEPAKTPS